MPSSTASDSSDPDAGTEATRAAAMPMIAVSWGEVVDKTTILEIKKARLTAAAVAHVETELRHLRAAMVSLAGREVELSREIGRLRAVNAELWDVEEALRRHEAELRFDTVFVDLARSVYRLNDERAAIKRAINLMLGSTIVEEKSYRQR